MLLLCVAIFCFIGNIFLQLDPHLKSMCSALDNDKVPPSVHINLPTLSRMLSSIRYSISRPN